MCMRAWVKGCSASVRQHRDEDRGCGVRVEGGVLEVLRYDPVDRAADENGERTRVCGWGIIAARECRCVEEARQRCPPVLAGMVEALLGARRREDPCMLGMVPEVGNHRADVGAGSVRDGCTLQRLAHRGDE